MASNNRTKPAEQDPSPDPAAQAQNAKPAEQAPRGPEMVEVRLLAKSMIVDTPDGAVTKQRGDVFKVERAVFDRSIEPDRGMGRPAHSRCFSLVEDEKLASEAKQAKGQAVQDRIAAMRESVRAQDSALDQSRALARHQEAENARAIAEALKPLERPGAHRVRE